MLQEGYIINPDPYLLPSYKFGPFDSAEISANKFMPVSDNCLSYFAEKHPSSFYQFTFNGRSALNIALANLRLKTTDIVTILTTTQNLYISNCVTTEIAKFCNWNREIVPATKAVLVNHEFGFPFDNLDRIKLLNIPIIEDCAYSFNSRLSDRTIGSNGDFAIYSFPKFFPIQIGGLLVSKKEPEVNSTLTVEENRYISNVLSHYINSIEEISELRIFNYNYLEAEIENLGLKARFAELKNGVVPGVFMFKLPNHLNAQSMKDFFYKNGVECSVFYGENSFFIPCHHKLIKADMDYFIALIRVYLAANKI